MTSSIKRCAKLVVHQSWSYPVEDSIRWKNASIETERTCCWFFDSNFWWCDFLKRREDKIPFFSWNFGTHPISRNRIRHKGGEVGYRWAAWRTVSSDITCTNRQEITPIRRHFLKSTHRSETTAIRGHRLHQTTRNHTVSSRSIESMHHTTALPRWSLSWSQLIHELNGFWKWTPPQNNQLIV